MLDASTANPPGLKAYPIVTYSWFVLYPSYPAEKARALIAFLNFALDDGQSYAPYFGYLPLPQPVVDQAKAAISHFAASIEPAREKAAALEKATTSPRARDSLAQIPAPAPSE